MTLITVIVPVYNVEPYLRQCLDSVVNQTYQNIEIILVDDGSPDHCGEICDEYARNDSRIIVIHQENAGLSAARNAALDIARGEYFMFVDSDDWVEPTFCEKALEMVLDNQVGMAIFGFQQRFLNGSIPKIANRSRIIDNTEAIRHNILCDEYSFGNAVWNKIFHRRLFQNLRFPLGMIYEDMGTIYKLIHRASRLYVSNTIFLYNYRRRKNSLNGQVTRKSVINRCHKFQIRAERLSFLKENYPDPELIEHQTLNLAKIARNAIILMDNMLEVCNPEEKAAYNQMSAFLKENKNYLLSLPCDKYTRIYLHFKTLYPIYMKLAHLKGKIYSILRKIGLRKKNIVSTTEHEYYP